VNPKHLSIPVSLCFYAVQNRSISNLQLFCWLKQNCNHRFTISNQLLFKAITELNITRQTFKIRLNWLLKNKWVSRNSKKNSWHLNSFSIIHHKTNFKIKKAAVWDETNFRKFNAFVVAAVLSYFAKRKAYIDKQQIRLENGNRPVRMKKAHPMMNMVSRSFNLPLNYFSNATNIPKSTIQKMKLLAKAHSFIEIKNSFTKTDVSVKELLQLRKLADSSCGDIRKLKIILGDVYEQQPDNFYLNIEFKNKRNLKHF
jgi:hypothetical protein